MGRLLRWILLLLVLAAIAAAAVFAARPQPVPVEVAEAEVAPLRTSVDEEGRTRVRDRYVVSSPLDGELRRVELRAGDALVAGKTTIAVIEPVEPALLDDRALAEAEARVRRGEAAIRHAGARQLSAQAALDFAEEDLEWLRGAHERSAVSDHELDAATLRHRTAVEEKNAADFLREIVEFELELARSALLHARGPAPGDSTSRLTIAAPIDGVVLRVLRESDAVVAAGTPLVEVGDLSDLELIVDVLSTDAVAIAPGAKVVVEHWGGSGPLAATVRRVEPSAFTKVSALGVEEQRVWVVADFDSPLAERAALGDGYRVEASITTWERSDVLSIPTGAAFRRGAGWATYVLEGGTARPRAIEIGRRNPRRVEILRGLEAGERVIVHPSDRVEPGTRVRAIGPEPEE